VLAQQRPYLWKRMFEAFDQLSAIVVLIHGETAHRIGANADSRFFRCIGEPRAEMVLPRSECHAASRTRASCSVCVATSRTPQTSRSLCAYAQSLRAIQSSRSNSFRGGTLPSRSIIVATGPSRVIAF